jgi:hypothetical protein
VKLKKSDSRKETIPVRKYETVMYDRSFSPYFGEFIELYMPTTNNIGLSRS